MAIVQPSPGLSEDTVARIEPIEQLMTSLPVFLGGNNQHGPLFEAVLIQNWSQYRVHFGAGGSSLSRAVYGYFDNGGRECYVFNWGENPGSDGFHKCFAELDAYDDISLIVAPGVTDKEYYEAVLGHCLARQDRLAFLDLPKEWTPKDVATLPRNKYAVTYTPWIQVIDRDSETVVEQPPSGHIAGIYGRVERQRGVHCPPANEVIRGSLGAVKRFNRADRSAALEAGVNLLRQDRRRGGDLRVWGAKTLSEDKVWQSLAVRRLVSMLECSVGAGTQWVVHKRNNESLWLELREQISSFLEKLRVDGLLTGEGHGDAYYVKCDAELNPGVNVSGDNVIFEVGVSPFKAGEFVIFRICQWPGGIDIAE
jgi:uncharacterized protein